MPRSYILANRAAAVEAPKPVFIWLHGLRNPDNPMRSFPKLDGLAVREGFVAVYPSAYRGSWNYVTQSGGRIEHIGEALVDDVGFLRKLLDTLIAEKIADPARVYIAGASQGGFLAYSLACEMPDRVAVIAPLLANMTEAQITACKPARIPAIAVIASPGDGNVLYDGGLDATGRMTSIPETMEFWRKLHGCTGQTFSLMPKLSERNPTRTVLIQ